MVTDCVLEVETEVEICAAQHRDNWGRDEVLGQKGGLRGVVGWNCGTLRVRASSEPGTQDRRGNEDLAKVPSVVDSTKGLEVVQVERAVERTGEQCWQFVT